MKLIIAGSRYFSPNEALGLVCKAVYASGLSPSEITEVIEGGAQGIDLAARIWAMHHDLNHRSFPADWDKHGPGAGPVRNREMAEYGNMLVAIPHPTKPSPGTLNMISCMRKLEKRFHVLELQPTDLDGPLDHVTRETIKDIWKVLDPP